MSALAIVANVIVPGAGLAIHYLPQIANFVLGINGRCDKLGQNQAHFRRVSDRLHEILMQLTAMHDKGQLPSPQVVKRYAELLDDFDAYLTKYLKSNFVCRLLTQDEVAYKITVFHNEVDELLKLLNLAHIAQMTDWRLQYEIDQREEAAKWNSIVATNRLLVDECVNARLQQETMLRLLHEIHQNKPATFQSKLVLQAYQTLQRLSQQPQLTIPTWFIPPESVAIQGAPFARGSTADIFRGLWRQTTPVVVKCFHDAAVVESELNLWSRLHHPNILHLYGGCHVGQQPFALCEEADKNSLDALLQTTELNDKRQLIASLFMEAAAGLDYLHGMGIIHGDIKGNNMLVTELYHLKLCDFGCAFDSRSTRPLHTTLAYRWSAPECLAQAKELSYASDIYSFGLTILEVLTKNIPFAHLTDEVNVREAIVSGEIPDIPNEPEWTAIMRKLCATDPADRLSLKRFLQECQTISSSCTTSEPTSALFPCVHKEKDEITCVNANVASNGREYGYGLVAEKAPAPEKPKKSKRRLQRGSTRRVSVSDIDGLINDIPELLKWLERPTTSDSVKEKLLQALIKHPDVCSAVLTHSGVPLLLHLVAKGSTPTLKELSMTVLALFARENTDVAAAIRTENGIPALVKLLRNGTFGQKTLALRALASITNKDDEACAGLLEDSASISASVDMLKFGGEQQQHEALCLVANLAHSKVHALFLNALPFVVNSLEGMAYVSQRHCFRLIINILHGASSSSIFQTAPQLISLVVTQCRLHLTDVSMTDALVHILGLLAFHCDKFCDMIVDAGAIPLLWTLYKRFDSLKSVVLITLANLATSTHHRTLLSRNNGLDIVLQALSCDELHSAALHWLHNVALESCLAERLLQMEAVNKVMNALLLCPDNAVALRLLALLSTVDNHLGEYATSGVVAWCVTQLVFATNTDTLCILLQNCVSTAACLEVFVMTSGVAVSLKRLTKAIEDKAGTVLLLGLLANVAVSLDNVQLLAENEATLYSLMRLVHQSNSKAEQLEALRCVANITRFEPSVMRVVKTSGVSMLFPILASNTVPPGAREFALDIVLNMAHYEGFHSLLIEHSIVHLMENANLDQEKCSRVRDLLRIPTSKPKASILHFLWRKIKTQQSSNQESNDIIPLVKLLHSGKGEALEEVIQLLDSNTAADAFVNAGISTNMPHLLSSRKHQSSALRVMQKLLDHCSEKYYQQLATDGVMNPLIKIAKHSPFQEDRYDATQVLLALAKLRGSQKQVLDTLLNKKQRHAIESKLLSNQTDIHC